MNCNMFFFFVFECYELKTERIDDRPIARRRLNHVMYNEYGERYNRSLSLSLSRFPFFLSRLENYN